MLNAPMPTNNQHQQQSNPSDRRHVPATYAEVAPPPPAVVVVEAAKK
jgi:hypothetical protein